MATFWKGYSCIFKNRLLIEGAAVAPAQPSYLDNCILLGGINGPLSVSKTKWSGAIWCAPSCCLWPLTPATSFLTYFFAARDMNVQGSQWASLSAKMIEQARALPPRIAEQLPNMIANVPSRMRNDSAAIALETGSLGWAFLFQDRRGQGTRMGGLLGRQRTRCLEVLPAAVAVGP